MNGEASTETLAAPHAGDRDRLPSNYGNYEVRVWRSSPNSADLGMYGNSLPLIPRKPERNPTAQGIQLGVTAVAIVSKAIVYSMLVRQWKKIAVEWMFAASFAVAPI